MAVASFFLDRFPTLSKHLSIFRTSWGEQNEREKVAKPQSDHEFLPAALEIMEKPASPGMSRLLLVLCSLFAIGLLWSFIGRVDVVATAAGRVAPSSSSKVIQPIEIGSIRAIHVRNGEKVKKGQLLVELDPTISGADEAQSSQTLLSSDIIQARNAALLRYLSGSAANFQAPEGTPVEIAVTQQQFIRSSIAEYEAERAGLVQQRLERQAELTRAEAEIAKLQQTLPLLNQQLSARQELTDKGFYSKLKLLEFEQLRVEHVQNIKVQQANAAGARAAIDNLTAQIQRLTAAFGRGAVSEKAEAEDRSAIASQELTKSSARKAFQQIRSPVDGTVQQLTLTTIGGVVQPAEPIMVIVPDGTDVIVNAQLLNRDIGFIHVGQPVRVKLEAYNFTDYGLIEGVVDDISRDAIQDEQLGLVYAARIKLDRNYIMIGGVRQPISPGLQVQAEIKTGERRIIDYLLSPIAKTFDEAGRER